MAKISATPHSEHGLKRQLGLRDLVLAQVLCVVGSGWVGVAAELGRAQALTWVAAMLLFYFPALQHYLWVKGPWKNPLLGKVQKRDFPTTLGNPAETAGFPVFPPPRLRRFHFF